jgi:CubicO group peptidase (beta-lactamase class C family)
VRRFDELVDLARARMEELGVPGIALGVLADGEDRTAGLGVTSVENPLEVTPSTLFQIGSITKTFTGTVALRLVEDGALDLDVPLRRYLPSLRLASEETSERVTMRHLLTHTGGWVGDYFDDTGSDDGALARMVERLDRLPQLTPLGTVWSYNNAGFYLAGRVLEVVGGKTYEDAVRELVLEPLGVERSLFFPADVMTHRFAVGHITRECKASVARPWAMARSAHPAGGLVSTVEDVLRYARFHLGDGPALLSPATLEAMRTPQAEIGGVRDDAIGLTWMLRERSGRRLAGHGGATMGQQAQLTLVPEAGFAVVVLTNSDEGFDVVLDVVRAALGRYLGVEDPEPQARALDEADLREYAGAYTTPLSDLVLEPADGKLRATLTLKGGFPTPDTRPPPSPPPGTLAFYDRDRVFGEGELRGARGEFLRDAGGRIEWFRFGGRLYSPHQKDVAITT